MISRQLTVAAIVVGAATLTLSLTTVGDVAYCQGSGCASAYGPSNKGFPKGTTVAVDTSGIPTTMVDAQGQPVNCVHNGQQVNPRSVVEGALSEMTGWNANNRSKVEYSPGGSSSHTVTMSIGAQTDPALGATEARVTNWTFDQTGSGNYVRTASVGFDLANVQGNYYDCSNPATMIDRLKSNVWHEMLHLQGVDNKTSGVVSGATLMSAWGTRASGLNNSCDRVRDRGRRVKEIGAARGSENARYVTGAT